MSTLGRPTSFRPEYCELARNYCRLGATKAELAEFFHVAPRTIGNWIADIPDFAEAVNLGRQKADARVARSLYQLAVGYEHTTQRIVRNGRRAQVVTYTEHLPPNERACGRWLRNRRPDTWSLRRKAEPQAAEEMLPEGFTLSAVVLELLQRGMLVYIGGTPAAETPSLHDESPSPAGEPEPVHDAPPPLADAREGHHRGYAALLDAIERRTGVADGGEPVTGAPPNSPARQFTRHALEGCEIDRCRGSPQPFPSPSPTAMLASHKRPFTPPHSEGHPR